MTISTEYAAVLYDYLGEEDYSFPWECLGLQALEVWAGSPSTTPGIVTRTLLAPQDYYVTLGGGVPTALGGVVTLTTAPPVGTQSISIERNTPISQVVDLKNAASFRMPSLEIMLDKMIMILQELGYKKCGISFVTQPLQPFVFNEYTVLSATVVDAAIQRVIDYIVLVESGAQSCKTNPGGA